MSPPTVTPEQIIAAALARLVRTWRMTDDATDEKLSAFTRCKSYP
jgi:hypothetical protein